MAGWIFLALIIASVLWIILNYNGLVTFKNQVQNAWNQIDVQLKRRHDLIPNLVSTVRGGMEFEKETLAKVVEARAKAVGAATLPDKSAAENALTQALGRLFALVENYPTLKSNRNILQLQEELTSTENKIGFARQFYNDLAAQFNTKQEIFPTNMMASVFGFKRADFFQAQAVEREVPKVDLKLAS